MTDSSFSDQVSGFPQTTDEDAETTPVVVNENTGESDSAEVVVPANSAYIPDEDANLDPIAEAQATDNEVEVVEQEFVIKAHMDPMRQKDPHGVYGDDTQRRQAEVIRARVEGREPDFENMGPTVGDVVITKQNAEQMNLAEPARGVPVFATAEVVVGGPEVSDAEGNVPETDEDDDE